METGQRFYFSNYDPVSDYGNWTISKTMRIFAVPCDWWSLKSWKLALDVNKNMRIVCMSERSKGE